MAEPLHWVIAAPDVVAGKGLQWMLTPTTPLAPEPSHCHKLVGVAPGLTPVKLVVTTTLQRITLPAPVIE